jgi:hypothetical protein
VRVGSADLPDGLSGIFLRSGLDRFLLICPWGCFVAAARIELSLRAPQSSFVERIEPIGRRKAQPDGQPAIFIASEWKIKPQLGRC